MGFFDKFPYTNFHELNEDWIISKIKTVETSRDEAVASAAAAKQSEDNAAASEQQAADSQSAAAGSAAAAADSAEGIEAAREQIYLNTQRLNNLIIDGQQTTGNTELLDIRVGYDGTIYDTAGNAVRDQVSDLYDYIDLISENYINLLPFIRNAESTIYGVEYTYTDGVITCNGTATATTTQKLIAIPKITLKAGTYTFYSSDGLINNYALKDSDGNTISGINNASTGTFTLSEETDLFLYAVVINGREYSSENEIILIEGDTKVTWVPATRTAIDKVARKTTEIVNSMVAENINLIDPDEIESGYLNSDGTITSSSAYKTTDYIPIAVGQSITFSPAVRKFIAYNTGKSYISGTFVDGTTEPYTFTATVNGYVRATFLASLIEISAQAEYGSAATNYVPYGYKRLTDTTLISSEEWNRIQQAINDKMPETSLTGKKWYPCGDSFTHGDFTGLDSGYTLEDGLYAGQYAVYPFIIGNRTGCIVDNKAVNGMTLARKSGDSAATTFIYPGGVMEQIPSDADIITLYFGINDSHAEIPIGTIDSSDDETFYGALNYAFDYLLTNYPSARIGVIISNGCDTTDYPSATIAACKKWGIPYLDINGDETLPMVIRTNMRTNLSDDAKTYWLNRYKCTSTNLHPNPKAHEDESYMIQQFLERL